MTQADKNQWVKCSNGHAPPGTLVGEVDITGEPIYVARASHNGDLIPGKMVASQRCAYISWGGLEFKKDEYEVLVGGSNNWKATVDYDVPYNALIAGETNTGDTLFVGRVHYTKEASQLEKCIEPTEFVTYPLTERNFVSPNMKSFYPKCYEPYTV